MLNPRLHLRLSSRALGFTQHFPVVPTSSPAWGQSHPRHHHPPAGPCPTFNPVSRTFFASCLGVGKSKTKLLILTYLGMWIFYDSGVSEGSKPGDGSLGPVFSCLQ